MTTETSAGRTARLIRDQANGCASLGSVLYAELLRSAADDLLAGGPTLALLDGRLDDPGPSALALRMMAGAHALALTGQAAELASFYPSAGGLVAGVDLRDAWRALSAVFERQSEQVRPWLDRPPQTNEVGRGAALIGGLCFLRHQCALPIRLVEIGASAGLNLRADQFHVTGADASYGPHDSPVRLVHAWAGASPVPTELDVVERIGGDIAPIDPTSAAGALALSAYVWPDQLERFERLRGALALARDIPAGVRRESAAMTLAHTEPTVGTWTVVWHSVFLQYLDRDERRAVDDRLLELGRSATTRARFAHISLEPERRARWREHEFVVAATTWPGGERRVLGVAAPHGVPVTWERQST